MRDDDILVFHDGEFIAREGDASRTMYVIQQGVVEVLKEIGGREVVLATLERGSFFGEMSLLESLPRSASVRAKGETRLLAIRAGSLLLKIRRDPTFAFELLQQMSGRIRRLNEQVAESLQRLERMGAEISAAARRHATTEYQKSATTDPGQHDEDLGT
jgi:CRP-like cAMP-binding protein